MFGALDTVFVQATFRVVSGAIGAAGAVGSGGGAAGGDGISGGSGGGNVRVCACVAFEFASADAFGDGCVGDSEKGAGGDAAGEEVVGADGEVD